MRVASYTKGEELPSVTTRVPGVYGLRPEDAEQPLATVDVRAGERLGFEARPDGVIVAVAAQYEIPIDPAIPHHWTRE